MIMSSNGNAFRVTCVADPLWEDSTDDRWIPLTKASDAELVSDEQTPETPMIYDAISLILTSLQCFT